MTTIQAVKEQLPKQWQVFVLPRDDVVGELGGYTAFCPFTKVFADGVTTTAALTNWEIAARHKYKCDLGQEIPPLTQRKIMYGPKETVTIAPGDEKPILKTVPYYIIDYDNVDLLTGFCPTTHLSQQVTREELGDNLDMPSFAMDWKVTCTPLMPTNATINHSRFSLTPHCIN